LVYITDSIPFWTPTTANNAWAAIDTLNEVLYFWKDGAWTAISGAGGTTIDSLTYASDTLYLYTSDGTFTTEIISSSGGVQYSDSLTVFVTPTMLADTALAIRNDFPINTDDQALSIDSTGRVFTISLTNGGSVTFEDTDTQYDLSTYVQYGDSLTTFVTPQQLSDSLASIPNATPQNFYVAVSGNDNNDGLTPQTAWQSIAKVNAQVLEPGNKVLFKGGDTFTGSVILTPSESGTANAPIEFGSYGGGRAIITVSSGHAMSLEGASYITVKDLDFVGSGSASHGIYIGAQAASVQNQTGIIIKNVSAKSFVSTGLLGYSVTSLYGITNTLIEDCEFFNNGDGIFIYPSNGAFNATKRNSNITIRRVKSYNNKGNPALTTSHSGSGIILAGATNSLIEYCEAYGNGANNAWSLGGPAGIWIWESDNTIIQYCESHHNETNGTTFNGQDGAGFIIDGGSSNCIIQYCYSHNNIGAGFAFFQFTGAAPYTGNIIRYNISQNDGRGSASFYTFMPTTNSNTNTLHNNVFYSDGRDIKYGSPVLLRFGGAGAFSGLVARNNIFYISSTLVTMTTGTVPGTWSNNTYFGDAGANVNTSTGGTIQNPQLIRPGFAPTVGLANFPFHTYLKDYELRSTSPCINTGATIATPTLDFFNIITPIAARDIGVHEYRGGVAVNQAYPTFINTDNQILSILNDSLSISGGNTVVLPFNDYVQYSDSLTVFVTPTQLSDSLAVQPQGTVTSVATGIGLTGGPITSTGTISADTTTVLASKTWVNTRGFPTGVGTVNSIPVWSTTTALGDSPLTVSGTDVTATGTGAFRLPNGTTAQRPTPAAGMVRYNTSNSTMEYYGASAWEVPVKSATATGLGTSTQVGYFDANGRLTNSANLTFSGSLLTVTGQQQVITSSYPAQDIIRTTAGTVTKQATFRVQVRSSGNMGDGFGTHVDYSIRDNAGVDEVIASIGAQRSGADNSGMIYISPFSAGVRNDNALNVLPSGSVAIGSQTASRTLDVNGEARIRDLVTTTPTLAVGADADGVLSAITIGSGLSLTSGTLSTTQYALVTLSSAHTLSFLSSSTAPDSVGNLQVADIGGLFSISAGGKTVKYSGPSGYFLVNYSTNFTSDIDGRHDNLMWKNGTLIPSAQTRIEVTTAIPHNSVAGNTVLQLTAGDELRFGYEPDNHSGNNDINTNFLTITIVRI
jgi:hypothetical protein